ncbi:TonB-dependent receptor [Methylocystis bryophila]|uniref:TonB-dependent receptor n=1 Tax=Methylocystis bryophila TaxID=655015 RepID=A0A1W6N0P0_9HYPH|nr:TonB-dependent receptor [Methylocystis bryophila]
MEEVKVTARLREEKAQDVPLPVSVVGGKTAEVQLLDRLQDLATKVPNFVPYITNPRTSAIAIRGITGISGGADGSESATGMIVDNVFFTHVGFQWANYVDLQSFEVARGPQGTLLGKNTTVGAVIIHTQLPSFEPSATVDTSFGNYNHFIERLNVTGPIIPETLAARATFYLEKSDRWIHNYGTGEPGVLDNNRWGVRGQLYYTGDLLTDRLIFDRLRSDETNNFGAPAFNSFPFYANGAVDTPFSTTLAKRLNLPTTSLNPYYPQLTKLGNLDQRTTGVSNEINHPVGEDTFTSVAAWREFTLHPRNTSSGSISSSGGGSTLGQNTDIAATGYDVYVDQYSLENRLASPKDETLEWTIGTYLLRETVLSQNRQFYGPEASAWFSGNPSASPFLLWGDTSHQNGIARTFSAAGFAQTSWHLDEQWTLTTGLRNTYEIREGSDFGWVNGNTTAAGIGAVQTALGGYSFFDTGGQTQRTDSLSGLINPSYRYNENILAYTSVARGEKSGAINTNALPLLNSSGQFLGFQRLITHPEVSWDYELGVKTNWLDNRLIVNLNVFWNDIYDFQSILVDTRFLDVTGTPLRKQYLSNIPQVRSRGFEFDTRWSPIDRLWINFSGQATDLRYVSFPQAAPSPDWLWPAGSNVNGIAAPLFVNLSGQRVTSGVSGNAPFSPYSFNLGANYEQPLGAALRDYGYALPVSAFGYANLSWFYRSQLSEPLSLYYLGQPSYSLINAGIGLKTDDGRYSANLWVKNLADARYLIGGTIGSNTSPGTVTFGPNTPRTFGGTLSVKLY